MQLLTNNWKGCLNFYLCGKLFLGGLCWLLDNCGTEKLLSNYWVNKNLYVYKIADV